MNLKFLIPRDFDKIKKAEIHSAFTAIPTIVRRIIIDKFRNALHKILKCYHAEVFEKNFQSDKYKHRPAEYFRF